MREHNAIRTAIRARLSTTLDQNLSHIQIRITEQRNKQATSFVNIIIIILLARSLVGPQLWPIPICKHIVPLG